MKRSIKSFAILLSTLALLVSLGCRSEKKLKPSPLAGDLYSGQSLQTVERRLHIHSGDWEVLEDRRPLSSDQRPPFRIYTIARKNLVVNGQSGELRLTFFNDRLMTTSFYPANIEAMQAAVGVDPKVGDSQLAPSTRVWVGKDDSGQMYVGWMDLNLKREYDQWVLTYEQ